MRILILTGAASVDDRLGSQRELADADIAIELRLGQVPVVVKDRYADSTVVVR